MSHSLRPTRTVQVPPGFHTQVLGGYSSSPSALGWGALLLRGNLQAELSLLVLSHHTGPGARSQVSAPPARLHVASLCPE